MTLNEKQMETFAVQIVLLKKYVSSRAVQGGGAQSIKGHKEHCFW